MSTVVVSAFKVASTPDFGGHFWVYFQYVHGLRKLGCDVFWLEEVPRNSPDLHSSAATSIFFARMERYGLGGRAILYESTGSDRDGSLRFMGMSQSAAEAVFRRSDLLLNFHYAIEPDVLAHFRRTALVDIDPGLLQFWMSRGQLQVPAHDLYLTIGETVGTPRARFPDCGLQWIHIRPPVCVDLWPFTYDPACERFTTVSSWLGGEYVTEGNRILFENDKRISFLQFLGLPGRTSSELELALYFKRQAQAADAEDPELLEGNGWRVRHALEVASSPDRYRAYIQASRGEFSCVKPSCVEFQNAWVSDRTLCYLASGKPVVVQDTGPSPSLPTGEGLFRFSTIEEAADALATIDSDYEGHCRAAREIAEEFYDAQLVLPEIFNLVETRGQPQP